MLYKLANRVAKDMNDEEIYDLVWRFPVLLKLPSFEWKFYHYDRNRDVHRAVLVGRFHVYLWLELAKYLSPGQLWCLQLALPGLFKVASLTLTTRKYRRENPFECSHCRIRTMSAPMLRAHVLMNITHAQRVDRWL